MRARGAPLESGTGAFPAWGEKRRAGKRESDSQQRSPEYTAVSERGGGGGGGGRTGGAWKGKDEDL